MTNSQYMEIYPRIDKLANNTNKSKNVVVLATSLPNCDCLLPHQNKQHRNIELRDLRHI